MVQVLTCGAYLWSDFRLTCGPSAYLWSNSRLTCGPISVPTESKSPLSKVVSLLRVSRESDSEGEGLNISE